MKAISIMLLAPLFLSWNTIQAQTATPSIMNTAGVSGTINNVTFEFSTGEGFTSTITNNQTITQGLLQPLGLANNSPLPVLGLEFTAKRLNAQQVQLVWKTQQEIANKGFTVQRKRETELVFTNTGFVGSKSFSGNNSTPLDYVKVDTNAYTGRTYYQLRQEDLNGTLTYSVVRVVESSSQPTVTLRAWPIPASKEFSVVATGIQKDVVMLYDATGRLVKQTPITEGEVINMTGLNPGTYFLKLKTQPDLTQKISVQ